MQANCIFLILFLHFFFVSCDYNKYSQPQRTMIAGKIENLDPQQREINIVVNQLGVARIDISAELDNTGYFSVPFEIYTPTDLIIEYKTNFWVLVHPGDSIYVVFDGRQDRRSQLLESVKFSGDAVQTNRQTAIFQKMFFSSPLYWDWDSKDKAIKNYDMEKYILYLDTTQQKRLGLYNRFVEEVSPNAEAKTWAQIWIEQEYYDALELYPYKHRNVNNLKHDEWDVPVDYYNPLLERLPIKKSMFICGYALSNFINRFYYGYVISNLWDNVLKQKKIVERLTHSPDLIDSVLIQGIINYTPDDLLRQMVLAEFFRQYFENAEIKPFERYEKIVQDYIKEPFLKEPLYNHYYLVKERLENPQITTKTIIKKLSNQSSGTIMNSIFNENKGKVIYIDVWATWCGPCLNEMPYSKKIMEELADKEITFIYLCIDSEEKAWKAILDEYKLGGQHFFLSKKQSREISKSFNINGLPFYILINKTGVVVETGSHIRPRYSKEKIIKLLNEDN